MEDTGEVGQMSGWMLAFAVARIVEQHRRRIRTAKGPVIADIGPGGRLLALAFGQHADRGVIGMQPISLEHVGFDPIDQRPKHHGAGADQVGQGRQAEIDALLGIALALAIQRLMHAILLEQDHRQKARAGEAARDHMERRWRLGDALAMAAGEFFSDVLDHLPLPRDHFQRLGDVLAELGKLRRSAAVARGRAGDHHPFARQIFGERLPRWLPAAVRFDLGPSLLLRRHLRLELVFGGACLELLEFELHLVEKARRPFRALAVELTPQLLDLQLQRGDQGIGARDFGLRGKTRRALGSERGLQGFDVVRRSFHGLKNSTSRRLCGPLRTPGESPCRSRPPGTLWVTIAVGTVVTDRPPHRSGRAQFRHPAPISGG